MSDPRRTPAQLVPLTDHHVAGMLSIFNRHIAEGFAAYPDTPVNEDTIAALLRQIGDFPSVAVETEEDVLIGFGFLRPYSPVATFAHTAQSTIFLDPDHTGAGIGRRVLRRLEDEAEGHGITRILAHISSRNPGSLAFHAKHGFVECGRFPGIGRKWGKPFDVVWMVKTLADGTAPP